MTTLKLPRLPRVGVALLLILVALVAAGCVGEPGGSGAGGASPSPTPLVAASPGADPVSLLSWLFTPIFQGIFILLVTFDFLTKNIAVAIVLLTLVIKLVLVPLFRSQTVSQRRIQLVQPEIREIQKRYKGDRARISQAQMELYKERGINPASGCLPLVLQFMLLIPMYSVIRDGLTNFDPSAMVTVLGTRLPILECQNLVSGMPTPPSPCINPIAFGVDWSQPEILLPLPFIGGLSLIAIISALLQVVQSRMVMPPVTPGQPLDQSAAVQRQTMLLFPFITIFYGAFLPAGLFLYWIVTTIFSIVQQYLIVGWGSLFPLFGWTPSFAVGHTPRFPVAIPAPDENAPRTSVATGRANTPADRAASAASTVRPAAKSRQGRRGRRR